jgi:hypothetical protein
MNPQRIDPFHSDPANWKLGIFYFCRADSRIIVPKRIRGLGWTLNLARPLAVPFLVFLMGLIVAAGELARYLGAGPDLRITIKVVVAIALVALCYRMARIPARNPAAEPGADRGDQ